MLSTTSCAMYARDVALSVERGTGKGPIRRIRRLPEAVSLLGEVMRLVRNATPGSAAMVSIVAHPDAVTIPLRASATVSKPRLRRLRLCINSRGIRIGISARIHPDRAADCKAAGDYLRTRESSEEKTVYFGADELDDESLDSRQHAVQSKQPALGVLVVAEAPQN